MENLFFCDLCRRRRERKFRTGSQFEINDFTDEELRARYRFKRESILFITNLVASVITRNTRRNRALSPLHQVLRIFVIFVLAMGCVTNSVTNVIIKANKESNF